METLLRRWLVLMGLVCTCSFIGNVWAQTSTRPATAPAGPSAVSPRHAAFRELASLTSDPYSTRPDQPMPPFALAAEDDKAVVQKLDRLSQSTDAPVAAAAGECVAARADAEKVRARIMEQAMGPRGEYQLGEKVGEHFDKEADAIHEFNRQHNAGRKTDQEIQAEAMAGGARMTAGFIALKNLRDGQRVAAKKSAQVVKAGQIKAWQGLRSQLPEYYATSAEAEELVVVTVVPSDLQKLTPSRFRAINRSRQPLTNVVLYLSLSQAAEYPGASFDDVFFVPNWESGQTLYLPTGSPLPGLGNAGPTMVDGVVAIRVEVWSDQSHQPAKTTRMQEAIERATARAFDEACERLTRLMNESSAKSDPKTRPSTEAIPRRSESLPGALSAMPTKELRQVEPLLDTVARLADDASPWKQRLNAFRHDPQAAVMQRAAERVEEINRWIKAHPQLITLTGKERYYEDRVTFQLQSGDAAGHGVKLLVTFEHIEPEPPPGMLDVRKSLRNAGPQRCNFTGSIDEDFNLVLTPDEDRTKRVADSAAASNSPSAGAAANSASVGIDPRAVAARQAHSSAGRQGPAGSANGAPAAMPLNSRATPAGFSANPDPQNRSAVFAEHPANPNNWSMVKIDLRGPLAEAIMTSQDRSHMMASPLGTLQQIEAIRKDNEANAPKYLPDLSRKNVPNPGDRSSPPPLPVHR